MKTRIKKLTYARKKVQSRKEKNKAKVGFWIPLTAEQQKQLNLENKTKLL